LNHCTNGLYLTVRYRGRDFAATNQPHDAWGGQNRQPALDVETRKNIAGEEKLFDALLAIGPPSFRVEGRYEWFVPPFSQVDSSNILMV
jgi:hypothetical protein